MNKAVLPPGFTILRQPTETWWIKTGWEHIFPVALNNVWSPQPVSAPATAGGRGLLHYLPLPDGSRAVIRRYRRGGFVRHFIHEVYWDRPFRPLRELSCTAIAAQRSVPTVTVLAAGVKHLGFGLYRGVFISREAAGFSNLWEWLQTQPAGEDRTRTIAAVARTIARLHIAGIVHADLNLTNVLVHVAETTAEALVIDFDKGRVLPSAAPESVSRQVLRRFQRSLHKLDPQRRFTFAADEALFHHAYTQAMTP
jgi:3-deoxy-D-manno-octulosonic acid kinase